MGSVVRDAFRSVAGRTKRSSVRLLDGVDGVLRCAEAAGAMRWRKVCQESLVLLPGSVATLRLHTLRRSRPPAPGRRAQAAHDDAAAGPAGQRQDDADARADGAPQAGPPHAPAGERGAEARGVWRARRPSAASAFSGQAAAWNCLRLSVLVSVLVHPNTAAPRDARPQTPAAPLPHPLLPYTQGDIEHNGHPISDFVVERSSSYVDQVRGAAQPGAPQAWSLGPRAARPVQEDVGRRAGTRREAAACRPAALLAATSRCMLRPAQGLK